jgi:alginate O-acetyltransferase complex protein AlgJ
MRRETVHTLLFSGAILITGGVAAVNTFSFHVPEHVTVVDGGFAKAFEQHYEERFPAKTLGVNLWAAIDYAVFREGRPGVVIGTHDWLYTDEEFNVGDDYDSAIRANFARIDEVRRELTRQGVALIAAVVPAKARIYPEYLSTRTPASAHVELYDEALAALTASGIPTADLRGPLAAGKTREQTYLRTDTHWAPWGARLAAIEVANVAREAGLLRSPASAYVTRVANVDVYRGDLVSFLPLDPYFAEFLPPREAIRVMKTDAAGSSNRSSSTEADLFGDSALPEVVLIGTSYSANPLWNFVGALKEALGEDVASYAREGAGPFVPMNTYLHSEDYRTQRPRLVIWEIPERSLLVSQYR